MSQNAQQQQQKPQSQYDYRKTIFLVPDEGQEAESTRQAVLEVHPKARVNTELAVAKLQEDTILVFVSRDPMTEVPRRTRLKTKVSERPFRYVGPFTCGDFWDAGKDAVRLSALANAIGPKLIPMTIKPRDEGGEKGRVWRLRSA